MTDPAPGHLVDGEPWAGPWRPSRLAELADALPRRGRPVAGRPAVVAVDGRSAGGKTTVADRLARAVPHAHVVHTDDVAWWHSFFGWTELMRSGVLEPVHRGAAVRFVPPAWTDRGRPGAVVVPADADLVVVEGVGAGRRELSDLVDAVVWVQAPEEVRWAREAARVAAGEVSADFVDEWQRAERPFLAAQRTWERAAFVVSGEPTPDPDVLIGLPGIRGG